MPTPEPYDGQHLIADLHGCSGLDDETRIAGVLRNAIKAAGATIIDVKLHAFGPGQGITGVALLAESHMSIHTWPEHGYAAIDIFMCGARHNLDAALAIVADGLEANHISSRTMRRGYGLIQSDPALTAIGVPDPIVQSPEQAVSQNPPG